MNNIRLERTKPNTICNECYLLGHELPYYDINCKVHKHTPREQKKILFLPNGLEHHTYLTLATDIIRLLTDDNIYNYKIIFRFHPSKQWSILNEAEQEKMMNTFLNKNFLVFDNKTSLHEQINNADLIIAGETTCFYEALTLNPNTIHYKHEKALGHITPEKDIRIITDTNELYAHIRGLLE